MDSSAPIHWIPIGLGIAAGFIGRMILLKEDQRHYPGYPAGFVTQVTLGFLSAVIGAVFFPALAAKQYTAATFLVLAATNFTGVRKVEVAKLQSIDDMSLVQRGPAYIQGIAQEFEQRNYLAMGIGVVTAIPAQILDTLYGHIWGAAAGVVFGAAAIIVAYAVRTGLTIGDVCDVSIGKVQFKEGSLLYVDDVMLMEVGLPKARERWLKEGIGVVLTPKTGRGAGVLWDLSQRQAIAQTLSSIVGTKQDIGYPERVPICRMDLPAANGRAAIGILAVETDPDKILQAARITPVLENAKINAVPSPALLQWRQEHEPDGR